MVPIPLLVLLIANKNARSQTTAEIAMYGYINVALYTITLMFTFFTSITLN